VKDLVKTGIPGLDEILYGGFLRGGAIFVEGTPGAGKTTLGLQFIYQGIVQCGEPGLIITFEEVPAQMYRDALNFGWDLRQLSAAGKLKVIPTSPQVFQQQIDASTGLIQKTLHEMQIQRILIDSITHFQRITSDPIELRDLINRVLNLLRQGEYTTLLIGERTSAADQIPFEEYVVDAVIRLAYEKTPTMQRERYLEITKARGQNFIGGQHAVTFGPHGMEVYPTPQPRPLHREEQKVMGSALERVTSGIEGLDVMIGGGYIRGFANLVAGESGTGKTSIGLHFVNAGAAAGEHSLIVSLGEKPQKIVSLARSIGMDLAHHVDSGYLTFLHRPPAGLSLNELFNRIQQVLRSGTIRRVLFDSLADIEINIDNTLRLRDYVYALIDLFDAYGVTSVLTSSVQRSGEALRVDPNLAVIVDSVLLLQYDEIEGRRRKVATVLKMRGSDHDPGTRGYKITPIGVQMGTSFAARDLFT